MAEPKSYRQLRKACWKGYQAIGVKQKNGRTVPNCVPESVLNPADPHKDYAEKSQTLQDLARNKDVDQKAVQQRRLDLNKEYSKHKLKEVLGPENDMGTPALTKKLLKMTPGQVVKEAKEKQEYDYEGDMARSQLRSIMANAQAVHDMLKPDTNMAEWVQSKITLAADYISTVADYMQSERNEVAEAAPAWTRKEGKSPTGGLNAKGIASYRRANPGSKLSMAVTTPPSKLDPDSKPAKRRRSFCARMGGSNGPMKDEKGEPTRKALALRKWNC